MALLKYFIYTYISCYGFRWGSINVKNEIKFQYFMFISVKFVSRNIMTSSPCHVIVILHFKVDYQHFRMNNIFYMSKTSFRDKKNGFKYAGLVRRHQRLTTYFCRKIKSTLSCCPIPLDIWERVKNSFILQMFSLEFLQKLHVRKYALCISSIFHSSSGFFRNSVLLTESIINNNQQSEKKNREQFSLVEHIMKCGITPN